MIILLFIKSIYPVQITEPNAVPDHHSSDDSTDDPEPEACTPIVSSSLNLADVSTDLTQDRDAEDALDYNSDSYAEAVNEGSLHCDPQAGPSTVRGDRDNLVRQFDPLAHRSDYSNSSSDDDVLPLQQSQE